MNDLLQKSSLPAVNHCELRCSNNHAANHPCPSREPLSCLLSGATICPAPLPSHPKPSCCQIARYYHSHTHRAHLPKGAAVNFALFTTARSSTTHPKGAALPNLPSLPLPGAPVHPSRRAQRGRTAKSHVITTAEPRLLTNLTLLPLFRTSHGKSDDITTTQRPEALPGAPRCTTYGTECPFSGEKRAVQSGKNVEIDPRTPPSEW